MSLYNPLPAKHELMPFGAHPDDWGGMIPLDWFHANHARFVVSLPEIVAGKVPYEPDTAPDGMGVYFLFDGDDLLYIGKSTNIRQRIAQHPYPDWPYMERRVDWFTHYSAIWVPDLFLRQAERFYIKVCRPRRNQQVIQPGEPFQQYMKDYRLA